MTNLQTKSQIESRIKEIRTELDTRHKYGIVKMASDDGKPISAEVLQNEMFKLIYKLSKILSQID
jgi:hypothetical protein